MPGGVSDQDGGFPWVSRADGFPFPFYRGPELFTHHAASALSAVVWASGLRVWPPPDPAAQLRTLFLTVFLICSAEFVVVLQGIRGRAARRQRPDQARLRGGWLECAI